MSRDEDVVDRGAAVGCAMLAATVIGGLWFVVGLALGYAVWG